MARRQGRVKLDAFAALITDSVMRALVPAINQRVSDAAAAAIAPLAGQVAELGELVTQTRADLGGTLKASMLDERLRSLGDVCERFCDRAIENAVGRLQPFQQLGPFEPEREYELNQFVTHRGCMWHARQHVPAGMVPGTDRAAEFWTLAVKCGRDAKGA